jgi:hypothetical protein
VKSKEAVTTVHLRASSNTSRHASGVDLLMEIWEVSIRCFLRVVSFPLIDGIPPRYEWNRYHILTPSETNQVEVEFLRLLNSPQATKRYRSVEDPMESYEHVCMAIMSKPN